MAELAWDYHNALQSDGREERDELDHLRKTRDLLKEVNTGFNDEAKQQLDSPISAEEVIKALKLSENHKAAGLDGVTYELWKKLILRPNSYQNEPNYIL